MIYAHRGAVSFLCTALPDGFEAGRTLVPGPTGPVAVRGYEERGWTGYEQSVGHLIKKSEHCLDVGRFSADEAAKQGGEWSYALGRPKGCPPYASKRFADKTVAELRAQASYKSHDPGVLASLVGGSRGPPLVPATFDAEVLASRRFTNGADHTIVASLYKQTAEALLASTPTLEFTKLAWSPAQFAHLAAALRLTRALETLVLSEMPLDDEGARALVPALPRTLRTPLNLTGSFTVLPELPPLPLLQGLDLSLCRSLAALPELSALTSLQRLNLEHCSSLAAEAKEAARRQLPSGANVQT